MSRSFRLEKKFLVLGALCFLAFATGSILVIVEINGPMQAWAKPVLSMIVGLIGGGISCLGLYMMLLYFRYRLDIDDQQISERGVFRTRGMAIAEVNEVHWIALGRGAVVLRAPGKRLRLDFENFPRDDVLWMIRYLRRRLPTAVEQIDWELFSHRIALPMRDDWDRTETEPDEVLQTRRRADLLMLPMFAIVAVVATVVWQWLQKPEALGTLFVVIGLWLLLRFSTPKEGTPITKVTAKEHRPLLFTFLMFGSLFPSLFLGALIEWQFGIGRELVIIPILIALLLAMITMSNRYLKRQQERRQAESPASAKAWEEGETSLAEAEKG